jgi:hypothetical protein
MAYEEIPQCRKAVEGVNDTLTSGTTVTSLSTQSFLVAIATLERGYVTIHVTPA